MTQNTRQPHDLDPAMKDVVCRATIMESTKKPAQAKEAVNHPAHYNGHPSGIECIDVVEHMGFNLGNAVKYIWRSDLKGDAIEDLRKAEFYIKREIQLRLRLAGMTK